MNVLKKVLFVGLFLSIVNGCTTEPKTKILSESERKQIYKELIAASDRAYTDADRLYPLPKQNVLQAVGTEQFKKNSNTIDELREKYKSEVAKKYGITREQREKINEEGDLKEWPMPPFKLNAN